MRLRQRVTRTVVATMAAGVVLLGAISPAGADRPVGTHNGGLIPIQCDGLGQLVVGFTTAGEWVHAAEPRLVADSSLVLVAYAFHYEFTPTVGEPIVVEGAKSAPKNGRLDRCVMTVNDVDGVFVATYWVSYTPRVDD